MFSFMAETKWPFVRIFRVLHTVQFSRFSVAVLSGNSDIISYCFAFVNNFFNLFFSFFSNDFPRICLIIIGSLNITRCSLLVNRFCAIFLNNFFLFFTATRYSEMVLFSLYFVAMSLRGENPVLPAET